jgi:hypothetical protein
MQTGLSDRHIEKFDFFIQNQYLIIRNMTILTIQRSHDIKFDEDGYLTDIIEKVAMQPYDVFFEHGQLRVDNDDLVEEAIDALNEDLRIEFDEDLIEFHEPEYVDNIFEMVAVAMEKTDKDVIEILELAGDNNGRPCRNCLFYGWDNNEDGHQGRCLNCREHEVEYFRPENFLNFGTWSWGYTRDLNGETDDYLDDRTFEEQYFSEDEADSEDDIFNFRGVTSGTF